MKKANNVLIRCLSICLASCIGTAQAADDAVLFKIHDIVPIKNADGLVISCELGATFYNRTASEINNAAVNLIWRDEVVSDAIDQEQRDEREATRLSRRRSRYSTSDYDSDTVTLSLKLPPIKSFQQVSLQSKINTNRCYLLLSDMEVEVANCGMSGGNIAKTTGRSTAACNNLFRFVSVKNPEYYTEFKEISFSDQTQQEQTMLEQQKQDIDKLYNEAIEAVNALSKTFTKN